MAFPSSPSNFNLSRPLLLLGLLPLLLLGCGPTESATEGTSAPAPVAATPSPQQSRLKVTATILPMYLFTQAVAGDAAIVELLIPPGTEVHEYQSRPADVQAIAAANILVKNGLGLEEFLEGTVESAQNPKLIQIDASQGIAPLAQGAPVVSPLEESGHDTHDHGQSHGHHHAGANPHVWLDPVRAQTQVANIRDGLIQADPANKSIYAANAAAYLEKLQQLDQQFRQELAFCQNQPCTFVTFHDAFPYLADRYQLKQVAVVQIPEESLNPADVQQVVATIEQYNVQALFGESGVNHPVLNTLSQDLKLPLKSLNSLESGQPQPQYYFTAMQENLKTLAAAFK